jgi:Beta-lactamase
MTIRRPDRYLLTLALLLAALPASAQTTPRASTPWPRATPAAQGLRPEPLTELSAKIRAGDFGHVDRMVVVRNGRLVVDDSFPLDYRAISRGKTNTIGCGIDACTDSSQINQYNYLHPDFHPWWRGRRVHTLQSVTKSVTATLFGVALERGQLDGFDAPLLSYFTDYDVSGVDPRLRKATLADLLTMRSGIEWHETDRPLDETNTTFQLEASTDWIRFTLAQPMDAEPGTKWAYSSGGSELMSEILRKITGMQVDRYAEQYLFGPLGIGDFYWKHTPTGHPDTEGGLYLEARDLARIGQLYLDDGVWSGQRILKAGFAREATLRHVDHVASAATSPGYGYQWWRYDRRGAEVWAGNGFGGQFLIVLPEHAMVGVINSWNLFGERAPGVLVPFIDALLSAAGV